MKQVITLGVSILMMTVVHKGYAQMDQTFNSVASVFKINFFLPGFSYEQKIAQYETIYFTANLDAIISNSTTNFGNQTDIFFVPTFNMEIRNYYNINRRERNGLRTEMNSANYIAPVYIGRYTTTFESREWVSQVGVVWGLQRNAPRGFSLDLNLGLGYTFGTQNSDTNLFGPIVQFSLGFWLGQKNL